MRWVALWGWLGVNFALPTVLFTSSLIGEWRERRRKAL